MTTNWSVIEYSAKCCTSTHAVFIKTTLVKFQSPIYREITRYVYSKPWYIQLLNKFQLFLFELGVYDFQHVEENMKGGQNFTFTSNNIERYKEECAMIVCNFFKVSSQKAIETKNQKPRFYTGQHRSITEPTALVNRNRFRFIRVLAVDDEVWSRYSTNFELMKSIGLLKIFYPLKIWIYHSHQEYWLYSIEDIDLALVQIDKAVLAIFLTFWFFLRFSLDSSIGFL